MIMPPPADGAGVEILRGPNIKPLATIEPLPDQLHGKMLLKMGDNISTDHILPGGAKVLPLRSNLPAISEYTFERVDPTFAGRARAGGRRRRWWAAATTARAPAASMRPWRPRYLGVRIVIVKSFARIHAANLVNFGILPADVCQRSGLRPAGGRATSGRSRMCASRSRPAAPLSCAT